MRISDWSSDVCSSDLYHPRLAGFGNNIGLTLVQLGIQPVVLHATQLKHPANQFGDFNRSEERREGKECVSKCGSRVSPCNIKKEQEMPCAPITRPLLKRQDSEVHDVKSGTIYN